jgi:hypothetical protein
MMRMQKLVGAEATATRGCSRVKLANKASSILTVRDYARIKLYNSIVKFALET